MKTFFHIFTGEKKSHIMKYKKVVFLLTVTAKRLRALREKKELSQNEVARILGISRTAYVKYENGQSRPTRKIQELCTLFNVSADYILGSDTFNNELNSRPEQLLSKDEWDLIHKYRQLSAKAKKKIKANVDIELDDYTESENESKDA